MNQTWFSQAGAISTPVAVSSPSLLKQQGIRANGGGGATCRHCAPSMGRIRHPLPWLRDLVSSCNTVEVVLWCRKQINLLKMGPSCRPAPGISPCERTNHWSLPHVWSASLHECSLSLAGVRHGSLSPCPGTTSTPPLPSCTNAERVTPILLRKAMANKSRISIALLLPAKHWRVRNAASSSRCLCGGSSLDLSKDLL